MPDAPQLPEDTWRYPPPPLHPAARWLAVLAPAVAVAIVIGSVLWIDRSRDDDAAGFLDDPVVTGTVAGACSIMTSSVLGLRVQGPDRLQAAVIADQNLAVREMVTAISGLDGRTRARDEPLDAWLEDWSTLVRARERYARQVGSGLDGSFRVPTADGRPITERMDRAGAGACPVPGILLDPYSADDIDV